MLVYIHENLTKFVFTNLELANFLQRYAVYSLGNLKASISVHCS